MSDAGILATATTGVLLDAIREGSIAAGVASDLARRIADRAAQRGVGFDDLLELSDLASRR